MQPTCPPYETDPIDYPAPKQYVLVISCMDARLLDDLVRFLEHDNLTNRYYHLTFAGTAMGLTDRWQKDADSKKPPANFHAWRTGFIDHFQAAVLLTKGTITDIYIVQHEDCGAFRKYLDKDAANMLPCDEEQLHREYAESLLTDIQTNFCTTYNPTHKDTHVNVQEKIPAIHTFFMTLRGSMKHLQSWIPPKDEGGICRGYRCYCPEKEKGDDKKSQRKSAKK